PSELARLESQLRERAGHMEIGGPLLGGRLIGDADVPVASPAHFLEIVGMSRDATPEEIAQAMETGSQAQPAWDALPGTERAACLDRAANLLEERRMQFLSLLVREAGKTLPDAVAELREAVDFCRYYAARGRELFGAPKEL